jgi:hypothetical protein
MKSLMEQKVGAGKMQECHVLEPAEKADCANWGFPKAQLMQLLPSPAKWSQSSQKILEGLTEIDSHLFAFLPTEEESFLFFLFLIHTLCLLV